MRLDVHVLCTKQFLGARDGQFLRLVDDLAPAVVAPAGIAFRVLVGEDRPDGLQHRFGDEVLRGDQLEVAGLPLSFRADRLGDLGIDLLESAHLSTPPSTHATAGAGHGPAARDCRKHARTLRSLAATCQGTARCCAASRADAAMKRPPGQGEERWLEGHSGSDPSRGRARSGWRGNDLAPDGNAKVSSCAPATPICTRAAMSSRRSTAAASSRLIRVPGCLGTKSVQQSASGSIEVSNVPRACAWTVISSLSMPISGRRIGRPAAPSMHARLESVCEATWPRLSPVTRAAAPAARARRSAMRIMSRRYTITRAGGGTESTTSRWISPNGTR